MANNISCDRNQSMAVFYDRHQKEVNWTDTQLVAVKCFGSLFCTFILVSNGLAVAAVVINRKFHFPFYYLLANLAASDFLAGIAYIYLMFNTGQVSRTLTVNMYFVRQGLLDISFSASLGNLLVIALERYVAIMSWKLHSGLTKRRVSLLIMFVWAVALFLAAVPSLGWNCLCNLEDCSALAPVFSKSYLIFWSLSNLVVFLVMVVIYTRMYAYVKRKTVALSPNTSLNRRRMPIKFIKTVMTILGAFVICWTPGLLILLLDGIDCKKCYVLKFKTWFLLLATLNSVMNPIIYSYKDKDMWRTIKNIICSLACLRHKGRPRNRQRSLKPHSDTLPIQEMGIESQCSVEERLQE
ncbi:lysophosphatidic acid receptor 3-like [Brienomyrus brachyistius]|uniref:lysophosphatidic acid receptor 3-like n=1 Tax=Brienomyrus brachyistius TaxID=42636 RepID=UPI0020B1828D|nr:lysophosphatidic acid receptor 3-like [Brienomyrus brachyistius]XP_048845577.1 lysophosphatidic acid receptor 3-like [Brienomyrus brachyistius]